MDVILYRTPRSPATESGRGGPLSGGLAPQRDDGGLCAPTCSLFERSRRHRLFGCGAKVGEDPLDPLVDIRVLIHHEQWPAQFADLTARLLESPRPGPLFCPCAYLMTRMRGLTGSRRKPSRLAQRTLAGRAFWLAAAFRFFALFG